MRAISQLAANVLTQRPNIRSFGAAHPHCQPRLVLMHKINPLNPNRARFRSTSSPSLASSYSFMPPTLRAEYIGGICSYVPTNDATASARLRLILVVKAAQHFSGSILCICFAAESRLATYSLSLPIIRSATLVAFPTQTGNTRSHPDPAYPYGQFFSPATRHVTPRSHHER